MRKGGWAGQENGLGWMGKGRLAGQDKVRERRGCKALCETHTAARRWQSREGEAGREDEGAALQPEYTEQHAA